LRFRSIPYLHECLAVLDESLPTPPVSFSQIFSTPDSFLVRFGCLGNKSQGRLHTGSACVFLTSNFFSFEFFFYITHSRFLPEFYFMQTKSTESLIPPPPLLFPERCSWRFTLLPNFYREKQERHLFGPLFARLFLLLKESSELRHLPYLS